MIAHTQAARSSRAAFLSLAACGLLLASCTRDQLLGVQTPDQITPEAAGSPTGANAVRVAAIGNFATFYAGDVSGSGVGINVATGLLTDEMESARGGTEHLDTRALNEATFPVTSPWSFAGQATTQLIRAIKAVKQYALEATPADAATKKTQIGTLYALLGMSHILLGEAYCNGIPLSDANDASPTWTMYTNQQLFIMGAAELDTAIATIGTTAADDAVRNLALVGKARSLVDQTASANSATAYANAAALIAAVPSNFVYNVSYSTTSIINAVYDWMNATLNFAPAEREGGNGLPFLSARDPRVTVRRNTDGTVRTQAGQDGLQHALQTVFITGNQPVPLASGVEARLIEAEAALAAGNAANFMTAINAARATRTDLPALTDPGTAQTRQDLLFSERGFWFWGTSHRIGDLRRLIRQYGRTQATVFPTGPYFKGGAYGTDVALRPSQAEFNNKDYHGCADVNP